MTRDKLHIVDTSFSHAPSSSWYNKPKHFDWVRNNNSNEIVTTNLQIVDSLPNKKVYGWIIEPPDLIRGTYEFAKKNYNKFEKIFTYDENLLSISNKFELLPIGGCWIEESDRKIYEKNKLTCTIASNKRMTPGHSFRHEVISKVSGIDLYGSGYKPIDKKIDILKDYMFCLVMENQKMDFLFTEKLVDCFMTGTIPIYWGCPSISKFFDIEGILSFNDISELKEMIPKLNKEFYLNKIESIKNNFELSKNYLVADNLIYKKIKNLNE